MRASNGTTPTNYTFTGQYSNMGDFGLMFYNARWYDPYLNHFTQPDSIVPDPSNSQDWDRYSYARNNPIRYTDPSGHMVESDSDGGSSLEQTLSYFEKYGEHGTTFNEYYATVYFAEEALAESLSGGLTKEELILLSTYDQAIKDAYSRALYGVHNGAVTEGMFSNGRAPLALRASELGFDYTPITQNKHKDHDASELGTALAGGGVYITWRGTQFELSPHALMQAEARNVTVNQVQAVVNNNRSFLFWHEGILKRGWYDAGRGILVTASEADSTVTTVMTNVDPKYVGDLRDNEP